MVHPWAWTLYPKARAIIKPKRNVLNALPPKTEKVKLGH
jgi:hypothetical protein